MKIIPVSVSNYAAYQLLRFKDSSGNDIVSARVFYNTTGSGEIYRLYLYYNGESVNSYVNLTTAITGVCVLKLIYQAGSGSDGIAKAYLPTYSDYQTNGWTNATKIEITNSTATASVGKLEIGKHEGTSSNVAFDSIRGDSNDVIDY